MHKLYETPEAEIVDIINRDVVTASMEVVPNPETPEDGDDWSNIIS